MRMVGMTKADCVYVALLMVLALSIARVQVYLWWRRRNCLIDQVIELLELGRLTGRWFFVMAAIFDHLVRCALLQGLFAF